MTQNAKQQAILQAIGIDRFVRRDRDVHSTVPPVTDVPQVAHVVATPSTASVMIKDAAIVQTPAGLDWQALQSAVRECQRCELHQTRTQTVFGVGNPGAELLFIGEAPGADEDRQGEPFVGRAGQLLNEMLRAIQLQRQDVYIANILKCRPPNNRDPKPEEAAQCWPYLQRQIELIQPRVVVTLGRIAAQRLLKTDAALAKLRQKLHQHPDFNIPVIVTYHPAYLLRSPADKRKAWEDLLYLQQCLRTVTK